MKTLSLVLSFLVVGAGVVLAEEVMPVVVENQEIAADDVSAAIALEQQELPAVEVLEPVTVVEPVKEEVKAVVKEEPKVEAVVEKKVAVKRVIPKGATTATGTVAFFNARGTYIFVEMGGGRSQIAINNKTNFFVHGTPSGVTGIHSGDKVEIDTLDGSTINIAVVQ